MMTTADGPMDTPDGPMATADGSTRRIDPLADWWGEGVEDIYDMPVILTGPAYKLADAAGYPSGRMTVGELLELDRVKAIIDGRPTHE